MVTTSVGAPFAPLPWILVCLVVLGALFSSLGSSKKDPQVAKQDFLAKIEQLPANCHLVHMLARDGTVSEGEFRAYLPLTLGELNQLNERCTRYAAPELASERAVQQIALQKAIAASK